MSVTMNLYKVVPNVEYLGSPYDKVKWSPDNTAELDALEESLGYREDFDFDELCDWHDKMDAAAWSDGIKHDMIDLVDIRARFKIGKGSQMDRGWHQVFDKLKQFTIKSFRNVNGQYYQYIPVDSVVYRQGWFLRKRWFNKKNWYYVATTKKQMEDFFNRYFDRSERAIEARKALLDAWHDGMIFEISW